MITVNALGPDGEKGTLRWAYKQINKQKRRVVCDPSLTGEIILKSELKWYKPRTTLDLSACDVTLKADKKAKATLVVGASHNNIFYSIRANGQLAISKNWIPPNNAGNLAMDGDSIGIEFPWDDRWDSSNAEARGTVRTTLVDRVTSLDNEDDGVGMMWEGVHDTTVSRSLISGFHPGALGAGTTPLPQEKWRLRVAHMYNVWFDSGERQTKPREQTHLWVYARNLVYNWSWYPYKDNHGKLDFSYPMGLNISDDYTDENDLGYITSSCFVPGPGSIHPTRGDHSKWGIIVGNGLTCEACGPRNCCGDDKRCELWNLKVCNPKLGTSRYYYEGIEGNANLEGHTWPVGYVPAPLPFPIDKTRPWSKVLAEVGVVRRNAAEQAIIDRIAANALPKCGVP